jgi:hypothetical protein
MDDKASAIVKRLSQQKALREPHESTYRQCFDYSYPLRGDGFQGQVVGATDGQNKQAKILDSTLTDSCDQLAASVVSGLTPSSSLWFGVDVDRSTDLDKKWLGEASKTLFKQIHSSNFDAEALECMLDMIPAGYFALYVDEDKEKGGFSFQQWPISQVYFTATKPGKPVDTVFREYSLSAAQAVKEFGEESLSEDIRKAATDKPDTPFLFVHAIEPRKDYKEGSKLARNLPVASCHVEVKAKKVVRESGYHEMPVIIGRWRKINGRSEYTIGPVFNALPDAKQLNNLMFNENAATDLAVAGMWIAEDDGVLNPRTVKVGPRKVIVANSVDSMKPLMTGADFNVSFTIKANLQAQIRRVMMADQLPPMDGPIRTATEFNVRIAMIRQLLGPIFGRLMAEYLQPLIERCFGIAYRNGSLGSAPESIRGKRFTVKYNSPMAKAQRQEEVSAIERYTQNVGVMAQLNPDVLDTVDFDVASEIVGDALGVPAKVLRDKDAVAAIRKGRADAQEQAKAEAVMAPAAQQMAMNATGAMQ